MLRYPNLRRLGLRETRTHTAFTTPSAYQRRSNQRLHLQHDNAVTTPAGAADARR